MRNRLLHPLARAGVWLAGLSFATVCLVSLGRTVITWHKLCPDFMCYWAAGKIISAGQSPYDFELQTHVQREYGWDKHRDGLGFYDFLPYRYPPSLLGLVCVLLVPLGFATARMTWFVVNAELLILTGYMLRFRVPGAGHWMPMAIVPLFAFSILAVLVGQVSPLILFLVVIVWRLLDSDWDRLAGCILAWISIKPQLTLLFLVSVLLWSIRRGRWRVIEGFVAGLVPLLTVSTWLATNWPMQLARSSTDLPLVTADHPWVGTSWFLLLRSIGFSGKLLWTGYVALAIPAAIWALKGAWDRTSSLAELIARSLLAVFFVAPYARVYDLPILLVPLLVLIEGRLQRVWVSILLFVIMAFPYFHFIYWVPAADPFAPHVWFCWIPLLLVVCRFVAPCACHIGPSMMQRINSQSRQSHNRS